MRHLVADARLATLLPDWPAVGEPIAIEFRPQLRVIRRQLRPEAARGREVHAAAYLRERRIVLDRDLLNNRRELRRILLHELFHFAWWKLGNSRRQQYAGLLRAELLRHARGELGWSAERAKPDSPAGRAWREYCCESFCDTGAWIVIGSHAEVTLAGQFRERRRKWWNTAILTRPLLL